MYIYLPKKECKKEREREMYLVVRLAIRFLYQTLKHSKAKHSMLGSTHAHLLQSMLQLRCCAFACVFTGVCVCVFVCVNDKIHLYACSSVVAELRAHRIK